MIINLKYYIITIIAIFLAIAIGLFIGIMLDGQDLVLEQQQQLVSQIENKFDEYKERQVELEDKISLLTSERENYVKFIDKAYPIIVKDQLKGLKVVIIETSEDYSYSGIIESFKKAGAMEVSDVFIKNGFLLKNEETARQVAKDLNIPGNTKEEIQKQLMKNFSSAIINGNNDQLLTYLKNKKLIDYTNIPTTPVNYVVIAGGSINKDRTTFNKIEVPFIQYIENTSIPLMAIEKSDVSYSNISGYKKLRISTVDNVEKVIGKVSMLMVASGQEGHFGERKTAEELMPEGFISAD